MARLLAVIVVVCVVPLVSACGSGRGAPEPPGIPLGETRPPQDLALAVTVIGRGKGELASLEPAWFVIEPDGVLRAATGEGVGPGVYPPRTRRLTEAQVREVYAMVVRSGLDGGVGGRTYRPGLLPQEGHWILIEVAAHERRQIALYEPGASAGARELAAHLGRLARLGTPGGPGQ